MTSDKIIKEKDMKKVLLGLFVVLLAGALVISCDSNATTVVDETTAVSFSTAMDRSLSSSVDYMDFASLDWYYQAIPATGAEFTHGATTGWTELEGGLNTTIELSQGIWTFQLQARNSEEAVYEGQKSGVLIKKQSTPIPVTINVTPVEGGNGTITLSGITIKGIKEGEKHDANKAVIDGTTVIALDGTDKSETVAAGNHSVVVSYEVNGILYGSETIAVTVYSGATVTISGFISEDSQSAMFVPNLDAPVTVFSKQLPVENISEDKTTATVKTETQVTNEDFVVTYAVGTPIVDANADVATNTADAKTGFKYIGDTLSEVAGSISISSSESVAQYELILNVATNNDTTLVKIEKLIEKNLIITKVLHNGGELEKTAAPDGSPAREYYEYSKDTGKLTLYVFHASPIDIITASLPTDAFGNYSIKTADDLVLFEKLVNEFGMNFSGKTVKLANDIDLTGVEWKPIGQTSGYSAATYFQGTFDGNGKTISNLTIPESSWEAGSNDGKNYATGFFGFIDEGGNTIKNVTFENANVAGHHWVGVVAGYMTGTVEDVTVNNAKVSSTYKTSEADGDKAGGVVGYLNSGSVTGCAVNGSTISAVRDCGSVVGYSTASGTITGNTAENCTVYYSTDNDAQIGGEIAGKRSSGVSNNTATKVTVKKVKLVTTLDELKNAINGMNDGDYVAFGANIVQDEVETSSGQITPTKASDALGEVNATIDLNGYMFDGQIGGWVFSDTEEFNLTIIGTDKVSAEYYEHETGHHMVKPHAINLYFNDTKGTMIIEDGLFTCNNAVLANGNGNLIIENGEFVAEEGIILSTYNKGTTIINGGRFITESDNATFVELEMNNRSSNYQSVVINDGDFVMESPDCAGFVIDLTTGKEYGDITINGGNFTFSDNTELVVALSWTGTNSGVVSKTSLTDEEYKKIAKSSVLINGGTFNIDPTEYVNTTTHDVINNGTTWTVKAK